MADEKSDTNESDENAPKDEKSAQKEAKKEEKPTFDDLGGLESPENGRAPLPEEK